MGYFDAPLRHVARSYERAFGNLRVLVWMDAAARHDAEDAGLLVDRRRLGRLVRLGRVGDAGAYPLTVAWVSPRLLWALLRAPEGVVIVQEFNLSALFAVLSKLRGRRRVVALVEGDGAILGRTGKAWLKRVFRRLVARGIDTFVANGPAAHSYLTSALGVPAERIVEGWWLAGLPSADGAAAEPVPASGEGPVLCTAGQLIPRKGVDLLLDALARYRHEIGPVTLWVAGDGPERAALEDQARRLGVDADVVFLGHTSQARLGALLRACDLFVFPTLRDLVGRVVVEALSVGTPVVLSRHSGAAHTLVRDGETGLVVDPRDTEALFAALRRGSDPVLGRQLARRARELGTSLTPDAAAVVVRRGVEHARRRR